MNNLDYKDTQKIISAKERLGILPGLARIMALLEDMDNPQEKLNIIHIAGTNGKGTVAESISEALIKGGYKVGLFTSPYVNDYREQIKINGIEICEDELSYYVEKYSEYEVTEFELLSAVMYKFFFDNNVDYAVVECGMGGLEDATNVESKNISVITSVSLDHTNFLGDTVCEIAMQKAGIIKENSTCILYPNKETQHIFIDECERKNTKLILVEDSDDFKKNNLNTAQAVLDIIDKRLKAEYPNLPARQERIGNILVDGGHNEAAGEALSKIINDEIALVAMLGDKDVKAYLSRVAPHCKKIIATQVDNKRAMNAADLAKLAKEFCPSVFTIENPIEAFEYARGEGLSLVCGSFYLARLVRKELL